MIEEEKNTEIERANRILFEKIKKIGQRSAHFPKNRFHTEQLIDEYNPDSRAMYRSTNKKSINLRTTQHLLA